MIVRTSVYLVQLFLFLDLPCEAITVTKLKPLLTFCTLCLTDKKPPKPEKPEKYSITLLVTNRAGKEVVVIPDDNDPAEGFRVRPNTTVQIQKDKSAPTPVGFTAVDSETEETLLINNKDEIRVTPSETQKLVQFLIDFGKCCWSFFRCSLS